VWLVLGNAVEVIVAALGVSYFFKNVPRLNSAKALAKYSLFAALLAPVAGAFIGALATTPEHYWLHWRMWFLADGLALFTLPPAIWGLVHLGSSVVRKSRAYYVELVALTAALIVFGYATLVVSVRTTPQAFLYLLVPLLLWSAFRFGSVGTSISVIIVSVLSIWGAVHGRGPWTGPVPIDNVLSLQLFLLFTAAPFMVLAILVEQHKDDEQGLRESEERLRLAQQAAGIGTFEWNIQSGVNRWTPELEALYGLPKGRFPGTQEAFAKMVHPDDFPRVEQWIAQSILSGSATGEWRVIWPDGTVHWLAGKWQVFKNEQGGAERVIGINLDIAERKQGEENLKASEEHSRQLVQGSSVAMIVSRGLEQKVELMNDSFTALFGYTMDDVPDVAHWWPRAYPDQAQRQAVRTEWQARVEKAIRNGTDIEPMEAAVRCKDGSTRYIEAHLSRIGETNLVTLIDLTERKRAEQALREGEERFRLVANSAPVLIWMSGTDKRCNYFNQPWLEFTGRPVEAELGNGWVDGVHLDDLKSCMDTYTQAFDRRENFTMEYRLRRHDGEYRWLSDIGVPRFDPDGSFAGYIGSCTDITDRKLAEEALAGVGRRLIEAHEEERTWIARELHDDVNQRIALLAIELERWNQQLPDSAVEFHDHIHHARHGLLEISKDIHALSHRLHSSKLEYLGLVVAANSFCKELSEQQKVAIDFSHSGIPRNLPKEVSLCLFRVLQEGLQNAVKHSGERHFTAKLHGTSEEIQLTVNDRGVGFDPQDAMNRRGLGLISMRERLQLMNGEFSIKSKLGHGTTVCARVLSCVGTGD
jgi:PAS domain S-box-containing protein